MLFAVTRVLAGYQDIYCFFDQNYYPFCHSSVIGHLTTHVSGGYCPHYDDTKPKDSIFTPTSSQKRLLGLLEKYLPQSISSHHFTPCSNNNNESPPDEPHPNWSSAEQAYLRFSAKCWCNVFFLEIIAHQ